VISGQPRTLTSIKVLSLVALTAVRDTPSKLVILPPMLAIGEIPRAACRDRLLYCPTCKVLGAETVTWRDP
jgi:hypothetical protein